MQRLWFERHFELGLDLAAFPEVLERIRGTPVRLEEKVASVDSDQLAQTIGDTWSIQENVGHLLDLEPLWSGRLEDLIEGRAELREADLTNRATHEADHNHRSIDDLLARFREARTSIVETLESMPVEYRGNTALHPRLRQPMTAVDLFFFVAEHDDHHLARMSQIARTLG